jgi:hypothetical protein
MKIEYITDWEIIYGEVFQQQWLDWVETSDNGHVFFHPALCMAWLETYRPLRKMKPVFAIGRTAHTTIFLPLVLWHRNWQSIFQKLLIPVGYSDFDYHDPIIINSNDDDNELINIFLAEIISKIHFDAFHIDGISKSIVLNDFQITHSEPCPYIYIKNIISIEGYLTSVSKNTRKSYKRRVKNLEEEYGNIEFKVIKDTQSDEFTNEFNNLLLHHTNRWPNAYKAPNFHINLLKIGIDNDIVFFSVIKVGDIAIAWQVGFNFKGIYYLYMPAINSDFMNYSPGKISLVFNIEHALKLNCHMLDQLRGDELYKSEWTDDYKTIYNYSYDNESFESRIKKQILKFKESIV